MFGPSLAAGLRAPPPHHHCHHLLQTLVELQQHKPPLAIVVSSETPSSSFSDPFSATTTTEPLWLLSLSLGFSATTTTPLRTTTFREQGQGRLFQSPSSANPRPPLELPTLQNRITLGTIELFARD